MKADLLRLFGVKMAFSLCSDTFGACLSVDYP